MTRTFYASLYQAPWKTLSEGATFPGFFLGKIFVYGYPSDTFVKLPVSEKNHFQYSELMEESEQRCLFGSTGLEERCGVHQWVEPRPVLVNRPPANTLSSWSLSQQWNQPGADLYLPFCVLLWSNVLQCACGLYLHAVPDSVGHIVSYSHKNFEIFLNLLHFGQLTLNSRRFQAWPRGLEQAIFLYWPMLNTGQKYITRPMKRSRQ